MSSAQHDLAHPSQRPAWQSLRLRRDLGTWLIRLFLIAMCLVVLLPIMWVFSVSVQPGSSGYSSSLIPSKVTWENYQNIFNAGFWTWARNSLILSFGAALTQLAINTLGAFAFSRLKFRGRRYGLVALFMICTFPQIAQIAAIFTLVVKVGLYDSLWGLYAVYIAGSAYFMMLLKNYMDSLPRELDESAIVDGANTFQIFRLVLLPLMLPILFTIFFFNLIGIYGEFIFASIILQSTENYTMMIGLYWDVHGAYSTKWAEFSAGAFLAAVPILIIYLIFQRFLVSGLAAGSVKG